MKSVFKLVIGIVIALILIGLAVTLFQSVFGYVLLFLAFVGAIVVVRQIVLGSRMRSRLESGPPDKRRAEARAHHELKQLEKRIRR